jgi:hypothetical protein
MAGFFEVLRDVFSATSTLSRLERENEHLRSLLRELELRVHTLEISDAVLVERASSAALEASARMHSSILERLLNLEIREVTREETSLRPPPKRIGAKNR